jgi:hypothetical protein
VQVKPISPKLKPPGTKRLKLKCDILLSTSAFKYNSRRYSKEGFEWLTNDVVNGVQIIIAAGLAVVLGAALA